MVPRKGTAVPHATDRGTADKREAPMARWLKLVGARDDWVCKICLQPVQPNDDAPYSGPRGPISASLDHVINRSQGGKSRPDNLHLCHRICNMQRYTMPLPEGFDHVEPVRCKICGGSISNDRLGSA